MLCGNKANDGLHFTDRGNEPLIPRCILLPTTPGLENSVNSIVNLSNPFDLLGKFRKQVIASEFVENDAFGSNSIGSGFMVTFE